MPFSLESIQKVSFFLRRVGEEKKMNWAKGKAEVCEPPGLTIFIQFNMEEMCYLRGIYDSYKL